VSLGLDRASILARRGLLSRLPRSPSDPSLNADRIFDEEGYKKEEIEALPAEISYNYALQLYPGFYLAERSSSELDAADCINHSCEPNCKLVNRFIMVANKMIERRSG
jgi:SET domain-containing protein